MVIFPVVADKLILLPADNDNTPEFDIVVVGPDGFATDIPEPALIVVIPPPLVNPIPVQPLLLITDTLLLLLFHSSRIDVPLVGNVIVAFGPYS